MTKPQSAKQKNTQADRPKPANPISNYRKLDNQVKLFSSEYKCFNLGYN